MSATYTEQERQQALTVYALESGRADAVKPLLDELGLGHIPLRTLRSWAYRDRKDEFAKIKHEVVAYVRSQQVDAARTVASLQMEAAYEGGRQLLEALRNGDIELRDIPKVVTSAMTAAGISIDKAELLSGNPTAIVKTDIEDVRRELAAVGITIVMPGADPAPAGADVVDVEATPVPALPAGD